MNREYDVFLSYNRDDQVNVEKIRMNLEEKYHLRTFLDEMNLVPGEGRSENIERALDKSATYAILIGPQGLSGESDDEMRVAFDIRRSDNSRRVIPVLLPGAPKDDELSKFLMRYVPIDFREGNGLDDENLFIQFHHAILGLQRGEAIPEVLSDTEREELINTGIRQGSHIPFDKNRNFTGRAEILASLEKSIFALNSKGSKPVILSGMGGVGKTQTAVEFAYRYGYRFRGVHWLNLDNPESLDSEIAQCGRKMGITRDRQDEQVAEIMARWTGDGPRLIILDNFDQIDQAGEIFSRLKHANLHLFVTSRRRDWPENLDKELLNLNLFQPQEAMDFLRLRLGSNEPDADLSLLAEKLGYLPLALEVSASYIVIAETSITGYLEELSSALEHDSMQGEVFDGMDEFRSGTAHSLDLRATFALSWNKVSKELDQNLFKMAGYLAPNVPIPLEIFKRATEGKDINIKVALRRLYGLNLLIQTESAEPAIHPLLADYARGLAKEQTDILEKISGTLATVSREILNIGLPVRFVPLRSHLSTIASHAESIGLQNAGALWNNYGYHLRMVADYTGAKAAFERALKIDEAIYGLDHPSVATDVNNLGSVLQDLGDLAGAKAAFERALKIDKAIYGLDHPSVATDVNNLGSILQALGDYTGAKAAFERALKIDEMIYGSDHPSVARDLNNLGDVLQAMGDFVGAKAAFERALKLYEATYGPEHPDVATLVNNLGNVLQAMGDLVGAKAAFERALKILAELLGEDHPNVATLFNNLGNVLQALGDLAGAKAAFERALKILVKLLGEDHPNVGTLFNNLGMVLQAMGDLAGAKGFFERALKIFVKLLGEDHPNVGTLFNNLGMVLQAMGDPAGAKAAFERALIIMKASLGADHPQVALGINNLGMTLRDLGDLTGAKAACEHALVIDKATYGPDHPSVARDIHTLGMVLKDLGDLVGAKAAFEDALKIRENALGKEHLDVAFSLWWLGILARDEGKEEIAKSYFDRTLRIFRKFLPPDHPNIRNIQGYLK